MSMPVREAGPEAAGRADLIAWERAQPDNYYASDLNLQRLLEFHWGGEELSRHAPRLESFGGLAATVVDTAVRQANLEENLPRLERYSAAGERIEEVIWPAEHDLAGRHIYGSGAMSVYAEPGRNLLALALFYLSSYNGEAGHNCPLACTAGVIKTLQAIGSAEQRERFLPRLLDPDYATRAHGAQFLTEVQGGSDVGTNACRATLLDEARGVWRLDGEKWFCSNVTADLALVTARPAGAPAGTRGLGLFLVPRRLEDGSLNGIHLRRLKEKLGTKSLATAEVDLIDARGYQVGDIARGFPHVMDFVINTSRLYNAVGSAGAARRAYVIARTYAEHRRAFGAPILRLPLVAAVLAEMRAGVMAMVSGSLYLAQLRDEIETGADDGTGAAFFRFAVNLNKYWTSQEATGILRRAIETLGGNGAMENFSVLPRLLRDCIIFEAWEGAHNTLLAQSLRDVRRMRLHEPALAHLDRLAGSDGASLVSEIAALRDSFDGLGALDEATASLAFRPLAGRFMRLFYQVTLAREALWEERAHQETGKRDVLEFYRQPASAIDYKLIERVSAGF